MEILYILLMYKKLKWELDRKTVSTKLYALYILD